MTELDPEIAETIIGGETARQEGKKGAENVYTTTEHGNKTTAAEWMNLKQPLMTNMNLNTENFARSLNSKGEMGSEEYARQMNYLNMQENYLKSGLPDARAYYGWVPAGISPMRLPALIYPHPAFLGFTPTVAWMKTNGDNSGKVASIEKVDRWESSRKNDVSSNSNSSVSQESNITTCTDDIQRASEIERDETKAIQSDEDEGMVLDEAEMLKRERQKEAVKLQTLTLKAQAERSSVIHENITIQAKQTVITQVQDATANAEQEHNKPAKRGRASTRHIEKTEQYWDRRKKNNMSAKKSRDARRQREALMNQRSAMLETENLRLRAELATLRDENSRLKQEVTSLKKAQN